MTSMLVTGGNGFVGQALCASLAQNGHTVTAAVRSSGSCHPCQIKHIAVGDISGQTSWAAALTDVKVVVHLAARVHVMRDTSVDPLSEFHRVNVAGTERLARSAAVSGVKRLVYISSIKVNGEETSDGRIYSELDNPAPQDPYGISKWEAEQVLQRVARETGLQVVIVRSPLVYGAGVKGNFKQLLKVLAKRVPLPLGAINNKRSLVALDNLVDLIMTCCKHPAAANQVFLAGDGEDLSTSELLRRIGKYLEKPARLIPVPQKIVEIVFMLIGRSDLARRLCGSLQVDISKARNLLGWKPIVTVDEALQQTARAYLED